MFIIIIYNWPTWYACLNDLVALLSPPPKAESVIEPMVQLQFPGWSANTGHLVLPQKTDILMPRLFL